MTVLQRVMAVVLAVLGACSLGLAIASATLWRPDGVVTASLVPAAETTMLVTEPGVLGLVSDEVSITAARADGGPVAIVVGREADVRGWVGADAHVAVSGLTSWTQLASSPVVGETTPVPEPTAEESPVADDAEAPFVGASGIVGPDPAGSDMWLAEATGAGTASLQLDQELGREMLLVAGTGDGAVAPTLTLSWPRTVSTPALVPGIVLGTLLLLGAAAVLLVPALPRLALRVVEARNRRASAGSGAVQVAPESPHGGPIVAPTSRFASVPDTQAPESQRAPAGAFAAQPAASELPAMTGAPTRPASADAAGVSAVTEPDDGRPLTRRELRERAEREAAAAALERGRKRPRTGMLPQVRSRADQDADNGVHTPAPGSGAAPLADVAPAAREREENPSARADAWRAAWGFQAGAGAGSVTPRPHGALNPYVATPASTNEPSVWTPDGRPANARTEEDA